MQDKHGINPGCCGISVVQDECGTSAGQVWDECGIHCGLTLVLISVGLTPVCEGRVGKWIACNSKLQVNVVNML
jgi:hypothetical protein